MEQTARESRQPSVSLGRRLSATVCVAAMATLALPLLEISAQAVRLRQLP